MCQEVVSFLKQKLYDVAFLKVFFSFFKLGFTPCKAEQSLQGMDLQEKETQKRLRHTGNLSRKKLQLKDVY